MLRKSNLRHLQNLNALKFFERENVMVRDYRENTNKWTDAKIAEKSGPLSYKVTTGDQGTWRRHADQMVRTSVEPTRPSENTSDVNLDISAPNISCESSDNSNQQQEASGQAHLLVFGLLVNKRVNIVLNAHCSE